VFIKLDSETETYREIVSELSAYGINRCVRVEIRSTGCCDPSLGLVLDKQREDDLVQIAQDLTFVMSPDVYALVGEVAVSYADNTERKGFVIRSEKPLSEWQGFAACGIRRE
jgi:Fe-S cluster assembly iron-binding protein IscA